MNRFGLLVVALALMALPCAAADAVQQNKATIPSNFLSIKAATTPDPGTLSLFGTGILGLAFVIRRRIST